MRDRIAAVVFVWNDGFDVDLVTFIDREHLDPVRDHTERRAETMEIVCLF